MADDSKVQIEFGAKIDDLLSGVDRARRSIEGVKESTDRVTDAGKRLLEIFGIAFSIDKIADFIDHYAQLGETVERTSKMLGLSTEKVGEFSFIAKATGGNLESMTTSLERMTLQIQRSRTSAFDPAALALQKLGLSAAQLQNLPVDQQFYKIAEAATRFNSDIQLANVLMALGGRGMINLLPVLSQGKQRLDELAQAARESGTAWSGPMVEGFAETNLRLVTMRASIEALGARVFAVLKPAIDVGIASITKWVRSLDAETIKNFSLTVVNVLGNAIISVSRIFDSFGDTLDEIIAKLQRLLIGAAIGGAVGILGGVGTALLGALGGAGLAAAWSMFTENYEQGADKAREAADKKNAALVKSVQDAMANIRSAIESGGAASGAPGGGAEHGGGKPSIGAMNFGAQQGIEAAVQRIQAEIAVLKQGLEQKKIVFDQEAALWQTTEDQKYASTMRATEAEYQLEAQKLQRIRDLWPAHSKEWEAANRAMVQSYQQHQTEMVRLNAQSLQSMHAKWMEVFSAMQSSFNSNLKGMLAGTTTWAQTFKSLLGDMVMFFIQQIEKMVFNWIAGQLAQVTASQSAEGAKAAAAAAGEAASLPQKIATFTSDVTSSAARVFAGASAFFAPMLGPGAPAAAAAVSAEVLSTAMLGIPKAEQGAWEVRRGGLTELHNSELVMPAAASDKFREFADSGFKGGGGDSFHLGFIDTNGAMEFMRRYAGPMATAVKNYQKLNPSLGRT